MRGCVPEVQRSSTVQPDDQVVRHHSGKSCRLMQDWKVVAMVSHNEADLAFLMISWIRK